MADYSGGPPMPANLHDFAEEIDFKELTKSMGAEVAEVVRKAQLGQKPTPSEIDTVNDKIGAVVDNKLDTIKGKAKEKLKIKPTDTPEAITAKTQITMAFLKYVSGLFKFIIEKMHWIISKIVNGVMWCVQKTTEFFQGLWSWLIG